MNDNILKKKKKLIKDLQFRNFKLFYNLIII